MSRSLEARIATLERSLPPPQESDDFEGHPDLDEPQKAAVAHAVFVAWGAICSRLDVQVVGDNNRIIGDPRHVQIAGKALELAIDDAAARARAGDLDPRPGEIDALLARAGWRPTGDIP